MNMYSDAELRKLQQDKYFKHHKQYKFYLSLDEDADVVRILNKERNKSRFIREALIAYCRGRIIYDKPTEKKK